MISDFVTALFIFLVTLVLVIWQPRGLGIGWSALSGAAVAMTTGVISWADIPVVWHIVWDATFTFVALIIISLLLEEAGFFHWAALHVARWGRGDARKLFPLTVLLGAVVAALFANDGAALLLTPIVLAILLRVGFTPFTALAFVIATGFVADTTSLPFVISNLVNIVSANYFAIPFDRYALVMVPVDGVAFVATLGVLWWYFRRQLHVHYEVQALPEPASSIRDPVVFRAAFPILGVLLLAYFVTASWGVPISVVTGAGALVLLAIAGRWHVGGRGARIAVRRVIKEAPWQIVLFSLGMYLVVYGLGNAGLTEHVTSVLAWFAHKGTLWAVLLGAVVAALFANDGAALLLTPIVLAILLRVGFTPFTALAFVIATGFVADTTSLPFVISNLVNIVSANYFAIPFDRYALVMVPVDGVAFVATLGVLWWYFRRQLHVHYEVQALPEPASSIRDPVVFRAAFPILGVLLLAYFVTASWGVPISVVTGAGALVLLAIAGRWHVGGRGARIAVRRVIKEAPWQIVLFSLGMYLVVYGLGNAGLTEHVTSVLAWFAHKGTLWAAIGTGSVAALLSSVMNNMPSVLIGALAIDQVEGISKVVRETMIYANVIGCDLGPKFTPIGSLATLLWLHVLARKGETISWGQYMKIGFILTPPVLVVTLMAVAIWLPFISP